MTRHPHRGQQAVGRLRQDGRRPRRRPPRRRRRGRRPLRRATAPARRRRCSPSPASCAAWRARSSSSANRPRAPMHVRCRNGLGYVTEERSVIMDMSVADNLKLAGGVPDGRLRVLPGARADHGSPRRSLLGRRAADAVAGAGPRPRTRRCCSPTSCRSAWHRIIVANLLEAVRNAADERGIGVLLVEQHVRQALKVADRAYVMERGRIVLSGTATRSCRASSTASSPPTSPARLLPADGSKERIECRDRRRARAARLRWAGRHSDWCGARHRTGLRNTLRSARRIRRRR